MSNQYHPVALAKAQLQTELQTRASRPEMLIENGLLMARTHDRTSLLRHTLDAEIERLALAAGESVDTPDTSMGFTLDLPDHAYNHGEIYNLHTLKRKGHIDAVDIERYLGSEPQMQ